MVDPQGHVSPHTASTTPDIMQPTCSESTASVHDTAAQMTTLPQPDQRYFTSSSSGCASSDSDSFSSSSSNADGCEDRCASSDSDKFSSSSSNADVREGSCDSTTRRDADEASAASNAAGRHGNPADAAGTGTSKQSWHPPFAPPPSARDWYGSMVAPYGANIQFVLYSSSNRSLDQVLQPSCMCVMCFQLSRLAVCGVSEAGRMQSG